MDQPQKKVKVDYPEHTRIFVQLCDPHGEEVVVIEQPISVTKEELQKVLQQVRSEEDVVYSFFHGAQELNGSLSQLLTNEDNLEQHFKVTFHPQAMFNIRPLTRQTAALEGHEQPVLFTQFHTLGETLATASGDTTIRVWDVQTETPIATLKGGHTNWVLVLAWSPDCLYLASGGNDGHVALWDMKKNKLLGILKGHTKWITSIAWEPMHLNHEATILASSSKDGCIRIWARVSLTCLLCISAHQKCITKMLWGAHGLIYTASEDTTIGVWRKNGQRHQLLKGHAHWVNSIALHTDYALRTACFDENQRELQPTNAKAKIEKILSGKNERLVSGSDDKTLCLWDHSKTKPIIRMAGHQAQVNHVQFSPDGRFIVSASFDKSLRLWDGYNGAWIAVLRGHVGPVYQVSWSSDSRYMVSASKDSTIKLWSMAKRKLLFDLPGHADEVYAIDWAPVGGEKAASGGKDRLVKIWRH